MKTFIKSTSVAQTPLTSCLVYFLLLEHFNAPGWTYGVLGTIAVIAFICFMYVWDKAKTIDEIINEAKYR